MPKIMKEITKINKRSFKYRDNRIASIWIVNLGIILIFSVPRILSPLSDISYYIANVISSIAILYILWQFVDKFPGVKKTGYYFKDNGITQIEYGKSSVRLDNVTELLLTEKGLFTKGIFLIIKNNGKTIDLLSEHMNRSDNIEDTDLYLLFNQILAENNSLKREKDSDGEPIDYWYKK